MPMYFPLYKYTVIVYKFEDSCHIKFTDQRWLKYIKMSKCFLFNHCIIDFDIRYKYYDLKITNKENIHNIDSCIWNNTLKHFASANNRFDYKETILKTLYYSFFYYQTGCHGSHDYWFLN